MGLMSSLSVSVFLDTDSNVKRSSLDDYLGIRTYHLTRGLFRTVIDRCPLLDTVSIWTLVVATGAVSFFLASAGLQCRVQIILVKRID
jgi:hypothetical protein